MIGFICNDSNDIKHDKADGNNLFQQANEKAISMSPKSNMDYKQKGNSNLESGCIRDRKNAEATAKNTFGKTKHCREHSRTMENKIPNSNLNETPIAFKIHSSCKKCSARLGCQLRKKSFTWNYTRQSLLLPLSSHFIIIVNLVLFPAFAEILNFGTFSVPTAAACRPGRYGSTRHIPRKMTPITYRQHVPNVSEQTIGASGPSEGKITRESERFNEELIPNWNTNIVFKDEENTNADRMMTERCKDRLNRLAIMVADHWKGRVKLRVIEAWDEDGIHDSNSLHYEGRAVDITTTDRDKSKYGMLARLAIEAGFDWVFYQSRSHIHCSVRSEKSDAARYGGCFAGNSIVNQPNGESKPMSDLEPGDPVFSIDSNGIIMEDEVLTFMDRRSPSISPVNTVQRTFKFVQIATENGRSITLTQNHLIRTMINGNLKYYNSQYIYAGDVNVGDYVFESVLESNTSSQLKSTLRKSRVYSVEIIESYNGAFAPLTRRGTIVVDCVVASCYAAIESHKMAHWVLSPMRAYYQIRGYFLPNLSKSDVKDGIAWYPKFLHDFGSSFFTDLLLET